MRKFLQYGFLLLFCYQLIGFFAFFEVEHYLVRKQVKKAIKLAVPENQLISFHFTIKESKQLKWVKSHEFRLHGRFYDVVHKELKNGIWHYHCINDIQETKLFERLSTATAVNLANTPLSHPMKGWLKVFEQAKELQDNSLSIHHEAYILTHIHEDYFHYENIYESHKVSVLERPPNLV